jgi:hypothetical protein
MVNIKLSLHRLLMVEKGETSLIGIDSLNLCFCVPFDKSK